MKLFSKLCICMLALMFILTGFSMPAGAESKTAEIAYVEWSCATSSANVVKAVLQEKMGYKVELTPVSAAAMWQALSTGDVDAITTAWLPTTHHHYYEKVKDKVENLGHNLEGTKIGLVVPTYVTIDSIEQLNGNADKFDGKITGIDPGAGLMSKTEKVIEDYKLDKMELMEGAGAMMTAVLKDRIKNKEWVVVTGWTPHWKFGRWDLKYLDDPKNVYGGAEYIDTVVRQGLKTDKPDLYQFLKNFKWTAADIQTVMAWNQKDDSDPYKNAVRWINENPEKVTAWLSAK
jgi:glycine betaine/proline transport system substrate-binding protein